MFNILVDVSATGADADAGRIAQWVGEALSNPEVVDSGMNIKIHRIEVVEDDA